MLSNFRYWKKEILTEDPAVEHTVANGTMLCRLIFKYKNEYTVVVQYEVPNSSQ
jgi:hypothetical protein